MLSKSAAKAFFLAGTLLCGGAFILLTIDTIKKVPLLTNEKDLTESVVRGKDLWDKNNCMGCHTIFGEGAYYAPELTKVYDRRGESFIRQMLKDPAAMYPGERKMVQYDFSDQEIDDLIEFFKWIGKVDLQGFPAKPDLGNVALPVVSKSGEHVASTSKPKVFNQMCTACHAIGGIGGTTGPALDNIGNIRDITFLSNWLKDPMSIKADSKMPKLPLSEEDIKELSAFLSQLKN